MIRVVTAPLLGLALLLASGCPAPEPTAPEQADGPTDSDATPEDSPALPIASGSDPAAALAEATTVLARVCRTEAAAADDPWALAHALLAFGSEFEASDGRSAAAVLWGDHLRIGRLGEREVYGFPDTHQGQRVEPHQDLIVRSLLVAGVSPEAVPGGGEGPTLGRVARDAWETFRFNPSGPVHFPAPDDVAWSLAAFCMLPTLEDAGVGRSQPISVEAASRAGLELLEEETRFLAEAIAAGETVQKERQGIFGHTCGGAHLLHAATTCAAHGHPSADDTGARVDAQVDILLWRLGFETDLVEGLLAELTGPESAQWVLMLRLQNTKFLGHLLEVLGDARALGVWTPDPAELVLVERARALLAANVVEMERLGIYQGSLLARFAASPESEQIYLDLVGDACHATRGLTLWASPR